MKLWSKEDRECVKKFDYFKKILERLGQHPLVLVVRHAPLDVLPRFLVHEDWQVRKAARRRMEEYEKVKTS